MFAKILTKIIEWLIIAGSAVMVGMVSIEVILRYCFGHTLFFTEELSRYIMIWIVFLGTALAMYEKGHISIDVLTSKLPLKYKALCEIFSQIVVIAFCAVLIAEGIRILPMQLDQYAISVDITLFWFYLAIPVGGILSVILLLPRIRESLGNLKAAPEAGKTLSGLQKAADGGEG